MSYRPRSTIAGRAGDIPLMPADFFVDASQGTVFSKATGTFSFDDAVDHMERLLRHPDFRPQFNQLADYREATEIKLSASEVEQLARTQVFSAEAKRAFVVSSTVQFGLARMFEIYRESRGERGIAVFAKMPEALAWLNLAQEPDRERFSQLPAPEHTPIPKG
jgi:hypothetical protein